MQNSPREGTPTCLALACHDLQEGSQEDRGSKLANHHFKSKDPMTQSGAMVERIVSIRVQVLDKRHALPGGTSLSRPGLADCDVEGT
jgi:hypothetical protein